MSVNAGTASLRAASWQRLTVAWLLSFLVVGSARAGNPFSSNVVELTNENWRKEVLDSPHAVFINICRQGCGYCQRLTPEWEKLANVVKGTVKIAYWDTEQNRSPPRLLGEIRGTPTIRLFKPKKKQRKPNSHAEKVVVDYQFERKAKDMKQFIENEMTNYSLRVTFGQADLDKAVAKAQKFGLPLAVLFTSKPRTAPMTKFLSTELRRRMLIAEVPPTTNNKELLEKFSISTSADDLPVLLIVPPEKSIDDTDAIIRYDNNEFTRRKLQGFLSKYALSDPVYKAKEDEGTGTDSKPVKEEETKDSEKKSKPQHVEL